MLGIDDTTTKNLLTAQVLAVFTNVLHRTTPCCSPSPCDQGRTDHLETRAPPEGPGSVEGPMRCPWGSLPKLKKAYEKGTRGILWGPLLTLGPRAV
ncbi:unnamed protein product, partial [Staurois parvus]